MSTAAPSQRIGIFGGTFDPIHIGHLLIAEQVRQHLQLAEVRFIPAAIAPHKQHQLATDAKHRLNMVQLAIGGNPFFKVDDRELRRGGTSYTVDTLVELKAELPQAELCLLIGADSLAELHTWRQPARICQLATVVIVARGGQPAPNLDQLSAQMPEATPDELAQHVVPLPQIEISSSHIRAQVELGRSVRYQLHPAVEAYIYAHELYVPTTSASRGT